MSSSYGARPIPPALAERLQEAHGLSQPPATLGEYIAARPALGLGRAIDASALCCSDSRHELVVDGQTLHTHCVIDSLLLPLLERKSGVVRSISPLSGEVVTFQVTPDRVEAEPPEAVISYGMLREGRGSFYETGCPYINAFSSIEEYERWAEATPEAVTLALPAEEAADFSRDLLAR